MNMKMTMNKMIAFVLLPGLLVSSPALAQTRLVDAGTMRQALAAKAASESDQRELVRRVLAREDVRDAAQRLGFSLEQADSAVATLSGAELNTLAEHASSVEAAALAGGANTIVISVTTLLLVLIIVILLAK